MGGGIGLLYGGTFAADIHKLVLIDSFGPHTTSAENALSDLRKSLEAADKANADLRGMKIYPTLGDAISARVENVRKYPGNQSITRDAAAALVRRGTKYVASIPVGLPDNCEEVEPTNETDGPVQFRHDPRLALPSLSYLLSEQINSFVRGIICPVLLVQAKDGWPVSNPGDFEKRKQILEVKKLITHLILPGSHHLHLDEQSFEECGKTIADFLK